MALLPALAGMVIGGFDVGRLWLTGAWLLSMSEFAVRVALFYPRFAGGKWKNMKV